MKVKKLISNSNWSCSFSVKSIYIKRPMPIDFKQVTRIVYVVDGEKNS